jgi:GntR family transcriptional regulator/MocR family aminotransferase
MRRDSSQLMDMLRLDRTSDTPLHRQLYNSLRLQILENRLKANTHLPPTRALASDLGISRNTVISAYDTLLAEGYLETRIGSGTQVAKLPQDAMRSRMQRRSLKLPPLSKRGVLMTTRPRDRMIPGHIAFHPGYPEIETFPFSTWSRLLAAHARYPKEDLFGYHHITGHPRLKRAIADYLAASRGVVCDPEQVVVVTGAQAGLDLIGRLLMDEGDYFWMEEPGYLGAYAAFSSAGGRSVPLAVRPEGWDLSKSDRHRPRLIFVTPSCQWPLGSVMQMEERLNLLQIAKNYGAWIIEDDYESEYRLRGRPIPAMQGLDRTGQVIYVGTFAKTLFPSLRIGFVVVPQELIRGFERAITTTGQYPPLLLQVALADFICEGYFASHIRRMRRLYAKRQATFISACREYLDPWLELSEIDAGMQLVGRFKCDLDDGDLHAAALSRGIDFTRLSTQYRHFTPEQGAMLGFAGVREVEVDPGMARLRSAFEYLVGHGS